jgi:hypothetical protein
MRTVGTLIGIVAGIAIALYLCFSFITVMNGKFDWDSPYALPEAVGAILLWLCIAYIASEFKVDHRRALGALQLFIGSSFLLLQIGDSAGSGATHEAFGMKLIAGLFFLAQGFENIRHKPVRS